MNTLGKTAIAEQSGIMSNFDLYSLIPFAVGMIVMAVIWYFSRRKSSAAIKSMQTELKNCQKSKNSLSNSHDELDKSASEDRRLRGVAEERLADSESAYRAYTDAAETHISELNEEASKLKESNANGLDRELKAAEKYKAAMAAKDEQSKAASGESEDVSPRLLTEAGQYRRLKPFFKTSKAQVAAFNKSASAYNVHAKAHVDAIKKGEQPPKKYRDQSLPVKEITLLK